MAIEARRIRRHVLLEPVMVLVAAFLGTVVTFRIQTWGIDHLGWFDTPCEWRIGIAQSSCLAPSATRGWTAVALVAGMAGGVGMWLGIRRWLNRRRSRLVRSPARGRLPS